MRRRLPLGLALPALLIALVAVFATLQYRWLGQVSEADREQMRRSLVERAREFATDFDREIAAAYFLLQAPGDVTQDDAGSLMAGRLEQWRAAARHPDLVRSVFVARLEDDAAALYEYSNEEAGFARVAWPDRLQPVRTGLAFDESATAGSRTGFTSLMLPPVFATVPAIVIPTAAAPADGSARRFEAGPGGDVMFAFRFDRIYTIVELDGAVLRGTILPSLARRLFPEDDRAPYHVAVVEETGTPVFTSVPAAARIQPAAADASARLMQLRPDAFPERQFLALRLEKIHQFATGGSGPPIGVTIRREPDQAGAPNSPSSFKAPLPSVATVIVGRTGTSADEVHASFTRVARTLDAGWTLLLQHPAGSIDAAVTGARRRNLWLSFGILAVLGAGVTLVVLNARRSEQLAAQQMDFVATVSHELRTPVAVIRSAAQNLSAGVVPEPARARQYGELIEAEGRRLTDMVEQVLAFAGLSANRRALDVRPVNPAELVAQAVESCQPLIDAGGFSVEVDVATGGPPLPVVVGHAETLRRALDNLISNALKYGADGRWLGITVRRAPHRGRDEVQLSVSDRGRGVDAADLPRLFEPFYRGQYAIDRQIQGNGLGLSLVQRIADAHGGRVTVRSTPGGGATFTIHLPAARPDRAVQPVGQASPHAGASSL